MKDVQDHTRPLFHTTRVVAGPNRFFAIGPGNICSGPIRTTLEAAEADANQIHAATLTVPQHLLGWGAFQ